MLKYKIIKNEKQYDEYCKTLEGLVFSESKSTKRKDEIDLLTLLIEDYDNRSWKIPKQNPVKIIQGLMIDHGLQAKDLVQIMGISKGYVSDILNYKKGLSKEIIRKLAVHFKLRQEVFNRPYELIKPINLKPPRVKKSRTLA